MSQNRRRGGTRRRRGDDEDSRKHLRTALGDNPHVPAFLLDRKPLPRVLPDFMELGGESEAVAYAADFLGAWRATPGAPEWLAAHAAAPPAARRFRS